MKWTERAGAGTLVLALVFFFGKEKHFQAPINTLLELSSVEGEMTDAGDISVWRTEFGFPSSTLIKESCSLCARITTV